MRVLTRVLAMALVALTSCAKNGASEVATEHFLKFEASYQSEEIQDAENALLKYRQEIEEARRLGKKGIDFDQAVAIADARLFVLYDTLGRTNEAEEFFKRSVAGFEKVATKAKREPPEFSRASMRETVARFDSGLSVRWKQPKSQ